MHTRLFALRRQKGQTLSLIETLVIVAIIAILAAVLIPKYLTVRQQSQVSGTESSMKNIAAGVEMYYSVNTAYPTGTGATVNAALFGGSGNNFYNGTPTSPNGGGNYTYSTGSGANAPAYFLDDPGTYAGYLIASLPKTTSGSDVSSGNCGTTCTHIEWNPDLGFTGH